jgi:rubrerythrin
MTLSRRKFLALASSSAAAASLLAACGSDSEADSGADEVGALSNLLTLEYVEMGFYSALIASGLFPARASKALGKFGEEEAEHAAALVKAIKHLGGKPGVKPKTRFQLKTEAAALELAAKLENTGAAAYLGQLPSINSEAALKTVLSIHSVEGRHAAAVNLLGGKSATPDGAFARPVPIETALAAVKPYLANVD